MPRAPWSEFNNPQSHLLVSEIENDFFGGQVPDDPHDSGRLREASNLMIRVLHALNVEGRYGTIPSRGAIGTRGAILCAFEHAADRDQVADIVDARVCATSDGWASRRAFPLTSIMHERLVQIGGQADSRWAGRTRQKREFERNEQSLRWGGLLRSGKSIRPDE